MMQTNQESEFVVILIRGTLISTDIPLCIEKKSLDYQNTKLSWFVILINIHCLWDTNYVTLLQKCFCIKLQKRFYIKKGCTKNIDAIMGTIFYFFS